MRKQLLAIAFVVGIAAAIQFGCGGGTGTVRTPIQTAPGSVMLFGGDDPLCGILSLRVTVTALSLTPQSSNVIGGSSPVSVLPGGQPFSLDFAALMDFFAPLSLASVPAGTYNQLNVTLANPQLTFWDTSKTPPGPTTISPTFSNLTIHLTLDPALVVMSNGTVAVQLNFDLLKSVTISNGQISGTISPTFSSTPIAAPTDNQFAEFEDLPGLVQTVQTTSTNSAFIGSFTMLPASGPVLTVYVADTTVLNGASKLSDLTEGMFVEVHAIADASGRIVAKEIDAELTENATNGQAAFLGIVTSVTRSSGKATEFDLYVREVFPAGTGVPVDSKVTFFIDPSTTNFVLTNQTADFADLGFDETTLAVGQRVVAHGDLLAQAAVVGITPAANARAVYLGLGTILGTLSTTVPVTKNISDAKLGGFTMLPCSSVFAGQPPITVLTADQTTFTVLTDLNGLTSIPPLPVLIIKGLLFYQQSSGSQNGVGWAPPANVQVATQVHQLP